MSDIPTPPATPAAANSPERRIADDAAAAQPVVPDNGTAALIDALTGLLQRVNGANTNASSEATALAKYFEAQEERSINPWRHKQQAAEREAKAFGDESAEELKKAIASNAKAALLTAEDVLTFSSTLFAKDDSEKIFYMAMLAHKHEWVERCRAHNWWQATKKEMGAHFLTQYGAKINDLQLPLFPPTMDGFGPLNVKILQEAFVSGGTAPSNTPSSVFRVNNGPTGGAPVYMPVLSANDGSGAQAVDMTTVNDFCCKMQQDIAHVKSENADLKRQLTKLRQEVARPPPANQPKNTQYGRGAHEYRARGRGQGWRGAPHGGDAPTEGN